MSQLLLILAAVLGLAVAVIHGYLGQVHLIEPARFTGRVERGMVLAIWHFSAIAWGSSAFVFLFAALQLPEDERLGPVSLACLPIAYGMICNAWITRGRHFGWAALALVMALALGGALTA
ncbi:MAG: hypothetical protein O9296_13690 [Novosphingobium sp.]|jgi:hypothetical protein|nr:hypothetical protein [Novosphingobium sp.]